MNGNVPKVSVGTLPRRVEDGVSSTDPGSFYREPDPGPRSVIGSLAL